MNFYNLLINFKIRFVVLKESDTLFIGCLTLLIILRGIIRLLKFSTIIIIMSWLLLKNYLIGDVIKR